MLENRNLRLDLCALVLLALIVFLSVSLLTYSPADSLGELPRPWHLVYQQDVLVYPQHDQLQNACGWCGALVSDLLFNVFGIAAYFVLVSLAVLDVALLRRQAIDTPVLRGIGWLLSLAGFTALLALLVTGSSPGPVIGAGGYLGVVGRGLLESHFATAGAVILATSLLLGGLLLCTDYALIQWSARSAALARQAVVKGGRSGKETASATAPESGAAANQDELPVRVKGKGLSDLDAVPVASAPASPAPLAPPAPPVSPSSPAAVTESAKIQSSAESPAEMSAEVSAGDKPAENQQPPLVKKRTKERPRGVAKSPHFQVNEFTNQQREEVMTSLDAAAVEDPGEYELPDIDLLIEGDEVCFEDQVQEVRRKAKILEKTFADFGFTVKVVEIETGPVIAQYEVELEAGLRLSRITGLADDLAIALRVPSVRIVAPIPGKNTVGIEVPNETRQIVRLREVIEESNGKTKKMKIPLFLGKDVSGNPLVVDLATLPHLLIAGRTGTGKSVCLNAIIASILMTRKPDEVRMLMIDPKMVELSGYGRLPHLMHPVVTDMRKAEAILAWAVEKMEERYALLARAGVRHITSYNQLGEQELMSRLTPETEDERSSIPLHLPFIVIVADEMADLMMTAGKEVEQHIIRLAQKSRAVGIHLILATQKPTVDVITGLIKSNLPARISFQVASRTDSRVVLDEMGADKLLGNGDMLFLWPGTSALLRGQGTYLSDEEINKVVEVVSTAEPNYVHELVNLKPAHPEGESNVQLKKRDELYESAVDLVVREGRGSVSLLQRALGIGYGRAARLIDFMAEDGVVGPYNGAQARDVLITLADWERMQGGDTESDAPSAAPKRAPRSNKVTPEMSWQTETPDKSLWARDEESDDPFEVDEPVDDDRRGVVARAADDAEELDDHEFGNAHSDDADGDDAEGDDVVGDDATEPRTRRVSSRDRNLPYSAESA